jgi:hypothetical protein
LIANSAEQQAYEQIRTALRQRISLDYSGTPLTDVVAELRRSLAINAVFDGAVLTDAGKDPATLLVTFQVENVTCEAILSNILSAQGLTWYIAGESLRITTKEDAETQLKVRVYLVRDLVAEDATNAASDDADPLIDLITGTVATATWSELGGPGTLEYFEKAGALVVSQTRDVHDELAGLLSTLRKARGLQGLRPAVEAAATISVSEADEFAPRARRYSGTQSWNRPRIHR